MSRHTLLACAVLAALGSPVWGATRFELLEQRLPGVKGTAEELATLYDRKRPVLTAEEQNQLYSCMDPQNAMCIRLSKRRYYVSDRVDFQKLSHFEQGVFSENWLEKTELFIEGQIRPRQSRVYSERERRSSHDAFVVSMSRWLEQDTYGCFGDGALPRPALAWYFWRHFGAEAQAPECLQNQAIPLDLVDDQTPDPVWISPLEVVNIHLAWVSAGKSFLSKWGHIMLILETESGKSYAVNFHAHMNGREYTEQQFSAKIWDGLTGEHVARLMPSSMESQITDYVTDEKRQIKSYALALTESEKTQVLFTIFEMFAYYRGSWRHLSSNCVSHIVDILRTALLEEDLKDLRTDSLLTPEATVRFFERNLPHRLKTLKPMDWGAN